VTQNNESKPVEPVIVEAVGIVARSGVPGLGKVMEEAMAQAVLDAMSEGITDQDEIRARMAAARDKARDEFTAGSGG
jgi:formaldehyde-activating enzyme involved in methanogenesis